MSEQNNVVDTLRDRDAKYGDYTVQAQWAQNTKQSCQRTLNWRLLTGPERESIEMIVTKLSRILHGDPGASADSWHDIAGYANLGGGWKP